MDNSSNAPHRRLRLYGPSLITLAILLPFFAYYIRQVESEQAYLNDHSFRVLDVMAQQFAAAVNGAHETMIAGILLPRQEKYLWENVAKHDTTNLDENAAVKRIQSYLTTYITDGNVRVRKIDPPKNSGAEDACMTGPSEDNPDAEKHSIERGDDSQVFIQLRHQNRVSGLATGAMWVEIRTQIYPAKMLARELGTENSDMFETVFVATKSGQVLAQTSDSRVDVSQVQALLDSRQIRDIVEGAKNAKGGDGSLSSAQSNEIAGVEQRFDVQVAGTEYVLFTVPAPILLVDPEFDAHKPTGLAFYGLVPKDTLDNRALQLPLLGMPAIAVVFVVGMAFLWPVLKLYTMSDRERLTKSSVWGMCGVTMIATLMLTGLYLTFGFALGESDRNNRELEELSLRIKEHFADELGTGTIASRNLMEQLRTMYQSVNKHTPWPTDVRFPITSLTDSSNFLKYPFLRHVILTAHQPDPVCPTPDERQVAKVSASTLPTPLVALPESKFPFITRWRRSAAIFRRSQRDPRNPTGHEPFVLESFVSPNTGEFIPTLMFYEDPKKTASSSRHIMLSTSLPSLVNVVFPPGFGFAVVNEDGSTQFHSDPSRNLRENFLRECQDPSDLINTLRFKQSRLLDLKYGGGNIRALVMPLEGDMTSGSISKLGLTLIVYYDLDKQDLAISQIGRAFLDVVIGLPLIVLFIVSVARLMVETFRRPANITFVQKRVWPWEKEKAAYVEEGIWGLVCFLCAVVVALILPPVCVPWILNLILAIFACGFISSVIGKGVVHSPRMARLVKHVPLSTAYASRIFGASVGVVGIVSILVFQLVLTNMQQARDREDYRTLRMAMDNRGDRTARDYEVIGYQPDYQASTVTWEQFCQKRMSSRRDIYDERGLHAPRLFKFLGFNWLKLPVEIATNEPPPPCVEDSGASKKETSGAKETPGADGPKYVDPTAFGWGEQWRALPNPFSGSWLRRGLTFLFYLAGVLVLLPIFLWLRLIIRRLFILDFTEPEALPTMSGEQLKSRIGAALDSKTGRHDRLLIFAHPQSGSGLVLEQVVTRLKQDKVVPAKFQMFDFGDTAQVDTSDAVKQRQAVVDSSAASKIAMLDNFEVQITDVDKRMEKLAMLEALVFGHHCAVYVLTSSDPLLLMESLLKQSPSSPALQAEMDRWSRVLGSFHRCIFNDETMIGEFRSAVNEVIEEGLAYPLTNAQAIEYPAIFREELSPTIFLRRSAERVKVKELNYTNSRQFEESLVAQVSEIADGYYRVLWLNCTSDERLALYQLAKDDWLNPLNKVAIAHLLRKQLIRRSGGSTAGSVEECFHYDPHRDGAYRLMNLSFRAFVLEAVSASELAIWTKQQNLSVWPALRTALVLALVLVALFVAYVRRDVFDVYFSYFAALAGGGAALIRIVLQFFSKDDPKVTEVFGGAKQGGSGQA